MDKLIAELKEYLTIDKFALDDEVVGQPSLFFQVSEAVAEAIAERDACKEELASIDAELDGKGRKWFDSTEDKYTEAMVKNWVQCDQKHRDAFDTFILAKTRADKLIAMKEAFQQRGYMLRDLVSLHETSYYDRASIQGNEKVNNIQYNKSRERLAEARKNRKDQ